MNPEIHVELSSGVLTVTISRQEKKNALTNDMYGALADAIARAHSDADVRVLLIQADGDTFTAGNDISEFATQSKESGPKERHVASLSARPRECDGARRRRGTGQGRRSGNDDAAPLRLCAPVRRGAIDDTVRESGARARGCIELLASLADWTCQSFRDVCTRGTRSCRCCRCMGYCKQGDLERGTPCRGTPGRRENSRQAHRIADGDEAADARRRDARNREGG